MHLDRKIKFGSDLIPGNATIAERIFNLALQLPLLTDL
jgi:hypothetical protein